MSKNVRIAALAGLAALVLVLVWRWSSDKKPTAEAPALGSDAPAPSAPLTVYSGRNEQLVGALFSDFEKRTGIEVRVRYGETPQLAALLLEEGDRTPADVYLAQDAGALGALAKAGRLKALPASIMARVSDERFKSPRAQWVGLSGRARVLAYNTDAVQEGDLPQSVQELTQPKWKGRVGWAPTNASFQAFVTALRVIEGEEAAARWLTAMQSNEPRKYKNNTAIIEALARGEVAVGLVNHYYVFAVEKGRKDPLPVKNHYFAKNDPGALINVAGVGIVEGSEQQEKAAALIEFLLGPEAQAHFARETFEYPLADDANVSVDPRLRPIGEVGSPTLDLSELDALQATVQLLQEKGVL